MVRLFRISARERVVQILSRRTKNNPVLIGEPGVGKTAIVEGLAERICDGDVPQTLIGKRVIQLDLAGLDYDAPDRRLTLHPALPASWRTPPAVNGVVARAFWTPTFRPLPPPICSGTRT